MNLTLQKTNNTTFVIPYQQDIEIASKLKVGKYYKVKLVKAHRNVHHHKKFFAILKVVMDNTEVFPNTEILLSYLKIKAGHSYIVKTKNEVLQFPKSISFDKMSQDEFAKFYDKSLDICADILKISVHDLEAGSLDKL